tara:strand:+ start:3661 stop:4533 length:873 start_codon:yes stop_codon:yes gene_type:complete
MNFTEQYNKELFDRIDSYRGEILDYLKSTNNHYGTKEIFLTVDVLDINYHRWQHPMQGSWELHELFNHTKLEYLSKLIKLNSVAIDIGAHTGNMSVGYSLFADKVIAFEPNPATFEVLEKNSKLNPKIVPYNLGCSDEEGTIEFHYSDPGFNNGGYATKTEFGIGVTGHNVPIEVYCVNVDNFIKELHSDDYNNIGFIKIDCEGHDKEILPTLKNIVEKNKPIIQTEIYDGLNLGEKQQLMREVDNLNYDCYNFTTINDNINDIGEKLTENNISQLNLMSGHNLICLPRD